MAARPRRRGRGPRGDQRPTDPARRGATGGDSGARDGGGPRRPDQGLPRGHPQQAHGHRPRGRAPLRPQGVLAGHPRRPHRAVHPRRGAGDDPAAPTAAAGPRHPGGGGRRAVPLGGPGLVRAARGPARGRLAVRAARSDERRGRRAREGPGCLSAAREASGTSLRCMPDADDTLARLGGLEGVASAMAATRDGIDALLRDRGLRRTTPGLTGESLLRGAHASAVLEGSTSDLEAVRAGAGDDLSRAAVRISAELLGLLPMLSRSPLQVFARLHTLAAAGSVRADGLGRPRDADGAARLRDLGRLLTAPTTAPALVVAGVVHAELAAAAPFGSRDGLVARAAERLVLAARGVDEKSLVVPEAGHLALRAAYESNLRGYRGGGAAGVHAWLLYVAEAYAAGAEASPLRRPAD